MIPHRPLRRGIRAPLRLELLESRLAPSSTQFAVIGDYGIAGTGESKVATLVKGWSPDLIVTVGDNNYEVGAAKTIDANVGQYYHDYIGNYSGKYGPGSATNRFFPTLGTHDWETRSGTPALPTPYLNYFTLPGNERYYTFTKGPVQFFCLDSGDGTGTNTDNFDPDGASSNSVQAQWLHSQLSASTAQWKLVFFHHPPFSSGYFGSTPMMQWPFQAWGATAVFSGHDHDYERINVGGMTYFVNGVGGESYNAFTSAPVAGSQVRYGSSWGAMHVNASDTQIQFQFVAVTGAVIDTYTMQATNALPTVSISATDLTASESGTDTGQFTITRTGSTTSALTVNLTNTGTATNGIDYNSIPNTITIPVGSSSTTITITPIDDSLVESSESVILTVTAGTGYAVGSANSGTVTILDNDSSTSPSTLVPAGSVWKYLDNGTNQGTAWQASAFADGTWKSGAAELGYGDGDEATVVSYGPNAANKYITTYFRKAFTVSDASMISALQLKLIRDDGAVVYLNGNEVFRSNMNPGIPTYTSLAPLSLGAPDESTWVQTTIGLTGLISGTNVLAVEIHQASPDSSDISFNLELDATINNTAALKVAASTTTSTPPPNSNQGSNSLLLNLLSAGNVTTQKSPFYFS
ncbi:MAG: metallophosphoesterase [Gemmataceae bacterium]